MNQSILNKLDTFSERYQEVGLLMSEPEIINNQNRFRELSKEYAELEAVVMCYRNYQQVLDDFEQAKLMMEESDPELAELGKEEYKDNKEKLETLEKELQILLLPQDPNDNKNIYLEIRAGTGGDEAAIFVGDLYRMYSRYAELKGWQQEIVSSNEGEHGGFKEMIVRLSGQQVYGTLKFESGAHRVQRVPETESQGRIHTSACTVAILPEVEGIEEIDISPDDLRIDTYRASGAGGQHVNRTDSAVRITHIPTNTVVECQDERSQHKNKAKAMALLQSRILAAEQSKQQQEQASARKSLVGSGDRSERIRTYNYPQGRVTDHRINLTLYKLTQVLEGELDLVIQPLRTEDQMEQLQALQEECS